MSKDIVERLRDAEAVADGDVRTAIHDACREILWMREGVALSKRAVEIAEAAAAGLANAATDDAIRKAWNQTQDPIATVRTFLPAGVLGPVEAQRQEGGR